MRCGLFGFKKGFNTTSDNGNANFYFIMNFSIHMMGLNPLKPNTRNIADFEFIFETYNVYRPLMRYFEQN